VDVTTRPCFLVLDREHAGALSTRKLVLESAKFNVITAYSAGEAIVTLERFPKVNAVVLSAEVDDIPCDEVVERLLKIRPGMPIIVTSGGGHRRCGHTEVKWHVDSLEPKQLLECLQDLNKEAVVQIGERNEELASRE